MRRVAVLVVLFAVMFALQLLRAAPLPGVRDPMTLAAIGFVLLVSFTLAELGSALTLPRVTGYILAGVALGPSVANVLSASVVQEMRMFNALALGLIATGAGLELDLAEIRRVLRTLLGTIAVKVVLCLALVGGAFVAIGLLFPALALGSRYEVYALGLVLAVLAVGTSPSISLAVKTETRAKGRLTDLVLGAAVLKDLVVVVGLAIAVALARSWLTPGQAGQESWLTLVAKELGGSLLAGSVLGVLLILYIRFVKAEMLLFVAAMILVVSEVGRSLHLELLLVFITAGFVVRNFSKHEHDLMPAVQMVSLPVFIVFFTIAGASVDLRSTLGILPVALALAAARAASFKVAARLGGRIGREKELIRNRAWLGYLPQAGVTLGLVGLAAQQLPTLADRLRTVGMAGVAINLLIGPIALKRVLKQAGETHEGGESPGEPAVAAEARGAPDAQESTVAPPVVEGKLRELPEIIDEIESLELATLASDLHRQLSERIEDFRRSELEPWVRSIGGPLEQVLEGAEDDARTIDALHGWASLPHTDDLRRRAAVCYNLFSDMQRLLRSVDARRVVALEGYNRKLQPQDPLAVRLRKRRAALGRFLGLSRATRRVPTRIVVRATLEARLAGFALSTLSAWSEAQAMLLADLENARRAEDSREETRRVAAASLSRFLVNFERHARLYLLTGFEELARSLSLAGGPALPIAQIRLSKHEPVIGRRLARLRADAVAWKPVLEGKQAELRAKLEIERLLTRLRRALEETVLGPAQTSLEIADAVLARARDRMSQLSAKVRAAPAVAGAGPAAWLEELYGAYPDSARRQLARAATQFRSAATVGSVAREIRLNIEALPATVFIPIARSTGAELSPATYAVQPVQLRSRVEQILINTLFPIIDEQLRQVFSEMAVTGTRIREAIDICEHALAGSALDARGERAVDTARAFERALTRLDEQLRTLASGRESTVAGVREQAEAALGKLGAVFETDAPLAGAAPLVTSLWRRVGRHRVDLLGLASRSRDAVLRLLRIARPVEADAVRQSVADADGMRRHVASLLDNSHAPPAYARLWQPEPVREHKLFLANRETLKALLQSERESLQGKRGSALLVGRAGAGRTSLLNLCEVELSAPRVLRPEPLEGRRSLGIIGAIAAELGLADRLDGVAPALCEVGTTVLIDDLEQWFTPDADGIAALSTFLALVVATDAQVFWLVAVEQSALALLEEAIPIRNAFTHLARIAPLSGSELSEVVEARHASSRMDIVYPTTALSRMFGWFGLGDARGGVFRQLARKSEGNLSLALLLWLRAVRVERQGAIVPALQSEEQVGASLLSQLSSRQLAVLSHLARFGPLGEAELSRCLELPAAELARLAHWFVAAGMLLKDASLEARLDFEPRLKPLLLGALRRANTIR